MLGLKLNKCVECNRLFYHIMKRDTCVPCENRIYEPIEWTFTIRNADEREDDNT